MFLHERRIFINNFLSLSLTHTHPLQQNKTQIRDFKRCSRDGPKQKLMSDFVKYETYERFEMNRKKSLDEIRKLVEKRLSLKCEKQAFWSIHTRENNTFRVGQFLSSKYLELSLENIIKDEREITNVSRSSNGARHVVHVYVQDVTGSEKQYVEDKCDSLSSGSYVELRNKDEILLFVKRVKIRNDIAVSLKYVNQISISKHASLSELRTRLMSLMNVTSLERLGKQTELFEIVTPVEINHLDHEKDNMTLNSLEFVNGDLICIDESVISQQTNTVHHHMKSIQNLLQREVNAFEIKVFHSDEIQNLRIQVSLDMTYDELAECVAKELVQNKWETSDLEPLTLQFVPWDVNSSVHFYGDAVEYDTKRTLKRLLVPYGYRRLCKSFKYERLPVPISELDGAESFEVVLRMKNGSIVKKNTYMMYGSTFVDVFEQLERYVC